MVFRVWGLGVFGGLGFGVQGFGGESPNVAPNRL